MAPRPTLWQRVAGIVSLQLLAAARVDFRRDSMMRNFQQYHGLAYVFCALGPCCNGAFVKH